MGLTGALVSGSLGKGKFNWGRALSWGLGGGLGGALYEKKQGDKHRAAAAASALEDQNTPQVATPGEDTTKPGQKMATLATSSQGLLTTPSVGRNTLLGY
jgi:hypothetical protein